MCVLVGCCVAVLFCCDSVLLGCGVLCGVCRRVFVCVCAVCRRVGVLSCCCVVMLCWCVVVLL